MQAFDRVISVPCNRERFTEEEILRFRKFLNCNELFNQDYTWGYSMALLDMVAIFESGMVKDMLRILKLAQNASNIGKFIKFLLYHREYLRWHSRDMYIGYDSKKKDFFMAEKHNCVYLITEI